MVIRVKPKNVEKNNASIFHLKKKTMYAVLSVQELYAFKKVII